MAKVVDLIIRFAVDLIRGKPLLKNPVLRWSLLIVNDALPRKNKRIHIFATNRLVLLDCLQTHIELVVSCEEGLDDLLLHGGTPDLGVSVVQHEVLCR